jgi:uncharacterized protein
VRSFALASLHRCAVRAGALLQAIPLLAASLVLALAAVPAHAQDVLPVPKLTARVIDQTGTLGAKRDVLEAKLAAFEQESGPQIVILMVPTTQPEDIASFAFRVADTWQIGRRTVGDGILIVVAKNDHHQRIEVARELEGAVPDLAARQIMDRVMRPAFRADDYAGGLSTAIDQLESRIRGENLPLPEARGKAGQGRHPVRGGPDWSQIGMLFFVGVFVGGAILKSMLGRTLGTLATGAGAGALAFMAGGGVIVAALAGVFALILAGLMGFGSSLRGLGGPVFWGGGGGFGGGGFGGGGFGGGGFGGGDGGGGGGFTSGGGGSFGGGGASSDW